MIFKIAYQSEIHLLKKDKPTIADIHNHIKSTFINCPANFTLFYKDIEGDEITITSQEDLSVIAEQNQGTIKIYIKPTDGTTPQL